MHRLLVERSELAAELSRLKADHETVVAQGHGYKVERDRLTEVNAELRQRVVGIVAFCDELERGLAADCVRLTGELAVARGLLRDDGFVVGLEARKLGGEFAPLHQ